MFREAPITPIRPEVATLAQAVIALVTAESDLARARTQVPDYTAQYDPKDYYAQEQEDWNQAAQGLYAAIHGRDQNESEELASGGDCNCIAEVNKQLQREMTGCYLRVLPT